MQHHTSPLGRASSSRETRRGHALTRAAAHTQVGSAVGLTDDRPVASGSRRVLRRVDTTLLDLVSDVSDTLRDDRQTVRLVAHWIRQGRVRTRSGRIVDLSSD